MPIINLNPLPGTLLSRYANWKLKVCVYSMKSKIRGSLLGIDIVDMAVLELVRF